jgi:outer membrane protein assembly factor BamE (lipoprotein component of BamABCDE complex)
MSLLYDNQTETKKRGQGNMRFLHGRLFSHRSLRNIVASCLLAVTAACSATYTEHGYVPTDDELANILVGKDTRETVAEIIGNPSSTGVLSESAWYYISSRIEYYAYRKPKTIERTMLAISFDKNNRVANIERFGLDHGRVITFSRRVTDSGVSGTTFFRQLVRNLGNFVPTEFKKE